MVFFYGGSWNRASAHSIDLSVRRWRHAAIVAVITDYRLYPEVRYLPRFSEGQRRGTGWALREGGAPAQIRAEFL